MKLIISNSNKLNTLSKSPRANLIYGAIGSLENYKVHGELARDVRNSMATRQLNSLSGALEQLLKKEVEEKKSD